MATNHRIKRERAPHEQAWFPKSGFLVAAGVTLIAAFAARWLSPQPKVAGAAKESFVSAKTNALEAERRLSSVSAAVRELTATAQAPVAEGVGNLDDPTAQELTAEDYIRQVKAEPRDETWADRTGQHFEEDLRAKAKRVEFKVRNVECRSMSCVAELNFSSMREAQANFKSMLGEPNRTNCHLRLLFASDIKDDVPILGVMIMDCHAQRAREAKLAIASDHAQPR